MLMSVTHHLDLFFLLVAIFVMNITMPISIISDLVGCSARGAQLVFMDKFAAVQRRRRPIMPAGAHTASCSLACECPLLGCVCVWLCRRMSAR